MEAYKFEAIVQENGVIQIPEISKFANREIEIVILIKPKAKAETEALPTMDNFLDKWKGILKGYNPDELKAQYFQEKYG